MILTYTLPKFKDLILSGEKIHTIRADPHGRWKPGRSIQHWMGNPRNVHAKEKPHEFAAGECKAVQEVWMSRKDGDEYWCDGVTVYLIGAGRWMKPGDIKELAENDGLTIEEFREWFVPEGKPEFQGRVIHFTTKLY